MNLTQRQLQLFVTTATLGHITRASLALHITQPGLSRALRELEHQLGTPLLARSTRRIALTEAGQRLLPLAQRLLRDMQAAQAAVQSPQAPSRRTVSVAVGTAFGCTVLPGVVERLAIEQPGLRLRLIDDNSAGSTTRVARGEVDLAIASPVGDTAGLHCHKLLSAPIGLLAKGTRFPLQRSVSLNQLDALPLLKEPNDTSIAHALAAQGSDVVAWMDQGTEVSNLALQLALAQAEQGVAVVSALGASHPGAQGLRFVPLRPRVERTVFLMHARQAPPDEALLAVIRAVASTLQAVTLHPLVRRHAMAGAASPA